MCPIPELGGGRDGGIGEVRTAPPRSPAWVRLCVKILQRRVGRGVCAAPLHSGKLRVGGGGSGTDYTGLRLKPGTVCDLRAPSFPLHFAEGACTGTEEGIG